MSGEQGIQGEPGERGPTGDDGQAGETGPRGPRASTWISRNLVFLFLLITLGNVASFVAMSVGFSEVTADIDRERRRQVAALCQVAMVNRDDNNLQNDAVRDILKAARATGSDPARIEILLSKVPTNRPAVECNQGTVTTTVPRP